ncbi:serine acetyltransferase [Archangium sp.]|jgi:serine O-acetyltransferase|uniref:serine O-acetyltransferase n=1 Tax=Archangium sp. TaxID=1872627 RepID=UPI002ED96BCA
MGIDAMTLYRMGRKLYLRGIPVLPAMLRKAIHYLHGSYIPAEADIGEGTQLGYGGMGIVIHKDAKIGRHCLISHQVTVGGRSGLKDLPVIGDYVRIGAGAKILGNIHIGDFAVIGANAVVVKDVAPGAVVGGIPAKELRRDPDPLATYEREMGLRPQPTRRPEVVQSVPPVSSAAQ